MLLGTSIDFLCSKLQSLSQFNLPVSLPIGHMLGPNTAQGSLPAIGPSSSSASGKSLHSKSINPPVIDGGLGMSDTFGGGSVAGPADFYDPDQPLWSNDHPATSTARWMSISLKLMTQGLC